MIEYCGLTFTVRDGVQRLGGAGWTDDGRAPSLPSRASCRAACSAGLPAATAAAVRPKSGGVTGVTLPALSPEQRAAALEQAANARRARATVRGRLKQGALSVSEVIEQARHDEVIGRMKVSALLESIPGVGKIRARRLMARLGIAETRRVQGLGPNQIAALQHEFAPRR